MFKKIINIIRRKKEVPTCIITGKEFTEADIFVRSEDKDGNYIYFSQESIHSLMDTLKAAINDKIDPIDYNPVVANIKDLRDIKEIEEKIKKLS